MPEITSIARWFVIAGLILVGLGCLVWVVGRSGLPLGRLPGDLRFQVGGTTCLIPLVSSLLLSILLTLVLNLIVRLLR
ncbi:MAG: DUF2905 family protein [Anaerolineales bacterium]|nr:DUF2905 family protein [Anaerolineales bacterium]